jgi:hypothetical protein
MPGLREALSKGWQRRFARDGHDCLCALRASAWVKKLHSAPSIACRRTPTEPPTRVPLMRMY